jgi:uncharacterized phage-associated protein
MKSPFTGKEMKRVYETRTWNFRGERYQYVHTAWLCEDSGELFTNDKSDMASFVQVANQYREKYGIPYTDEIIAVRQRYGISAAKMSQILGFGINQYRLYEQGEVPNISNGRMIRSIMNPIVMLELVESSKNSLTESEYDKIVRSIRVFIDNAADDKIERYEQLRIFSEPRSNANGYAPLSLSRLKNVMLYILERCDDVWCTKMNKLLFYIDFVAYRECGMAITGLPYRAIDYGPVPDRWSRVYSEFADIKQELQPIGEFVGNILKSTSKADIAQFNADELEIMSNVCQSLGEKSASELSRISHAEKAWLDYHEGHSLIPFATAFDIVAI